MNNLCVKRLYSYFVRSYLHGVVIFADYTKEDLKMEWVKVEDRLPEKGCWLIVFSYMDVITAGWDNEQKRFFIGAEYLNNVTHWMSLPEKPKAI